MPLNLPAAPIVSNISSTTATISIGTDFNPPGSTFYSFRIISNGIINYLLSNGLLSSSNMYTNIPSITAVQLSSGTQYIVSASAATDAQGSNATAYGPFTQFPTLLGEVSLQGNFTSQQQQIIDKSRLLMPEKFSVNVGDERILAFAELVIADINVMPPLQGYTTDTMDSVALPLVYFGISLFADLFFQMGATLLDFNYNDNGISLNIDQTGKIGQSYVNMLNFYDKMKSNYKKTQILKQGAYGISSPRYQSQIGQFLKISLGASFNWNSPS
jgi:hypothetical protein